MSKNDVTLVVHSHKAGNNEHAARIIASKLGCEYVSVSDKPSLQKYERIILVIPNTGDEELPQEMEDFLCDLSIRNKSYYICELGNFFGLFDYQGCKKIAVAILSAIGWHLISDISIDSYPALDINSLNEWLHIVDTADDLAPS